MCYRPIRISNPTHSFSLRDRAFLSVPCGKCCDCQTRRRSDWFVRCYYQYLETIEKYHGTVFYITLTYRPFRLPRYNGVPCFDKKHIQDYLKRIRRRFEWHYCENVPIKYFITSEYGIKRHRPHYHGLIFVERPLSQIDRYFFKSILRSSWEDYNGFVSFGRKKQFIKEVGVVQSPSALSYVAKYIGKSDSFDYSIPKRFHPFHLQSQGFGSYLIQKHNLSDASDSSKDFFVNGKVYPAGSAFGYSIPQYIVRKVLYDYSYTVEYFKHRALKSDVISLGIKEYVTDRYDDRYVVYQTRIPHVVYTLNEFGKRVKYELELKFLDSFIVRVNSLMSQMKLYVFSDKYLHYLNNTYNTSYSSFDELYDLWNSVDKFDFSVYYNLLKDRIYIDVSDFVEFPKFPRHRLFYRQYLHSLFFGDLSKANTVVDVSTGFEVDLDSILCFYCRDLVHEFSFNTHVPIEYSFLCDLISFVQLSVGRVCQKDYDYKNMLYENAKSALAEVV